MCRSQSPIDILNITNVGATATEGETASVNIVNKSSGSGVDFNFVLPRGEQGVQGEQGIQGEPGAAGSGGDTETVVQGLHAQLNLHGGGIVPFNSSGYLKWDYRIIAIPVKKPEFGASGYIDINCPTSGTITYYN